MCFKKLPKWIVPTTPASFDDKESGTAIEMVGRIYKKMNELVDSYNQFVEDVNNGNKTFTENLNEELETFAAGLRQEFQDFIDTINLEFDHFKNTAKDEIISEAESEIEKLFQRMTANINIPKKVSELENDAGFITRADLPEGGNGNSGNGVFVVTPNVTTFDEIRTAYESGKQIYVALNDGTGDDDGYIIAPLTMYLPYYSFASFNAVYTAPTGLTTIGNFVLNNGVWSVNYEPVPNSETWTFTVKKDDGTEETITKAVYVE